MLALAGCGFGDDGQGDNPLLNPKNVTRDEVPGGGRELSEGEQETLKKQQRSAEKELERDVGEVIEVKEVKTEDVSKDLKDALAEAREKAARGKKLSRKEADAVNEKTVSALIASVLKVMGLERSKAAVGKGGRSVVILIHPQEACLLTPARQREFRRRIVKSARIVKRVSMRVGTRSLSAYRKRNCRGSSGRGKSKRGERGGSVDGGGTGKVVYSASSPPKTGLVQSPKFKITAKRWRIEYENLGVTFQIFLHDGQGRLREVAVNENKSGSGFKELEGPGRFMISIGGTGVWSVKVRDGR